MSFWGGVAKGLEAGEAKREREQAREDQVGARQEAKDWQQKMFDYRVKQDGAAASVAANQLSFKNSIAVLDLMGTTAKNVSGAPKGAGKPKQSLEASINILKANGASDEVLSSFAGHGALALSKAVDAWGVYQSEVKDRPSGTVRTIDDFLTTAVATTNPGVEPDMAEAARVMGISEEELDNPMYKGTGYTWRDAINKKLGKESSTSVYFGPTGTTPDVFDPAKAVKQANESVDGVLTAQISQNNVTLSSLEVGTDQYKAVSAENARISQAMKAMKEGRPAEAIRLVGANAMLPMLSNTPGSLEYNLGGGWDQAIDNVTFTNTEDYANAFAKGAVGVGDWVVVDGSILRIKEPPVVDSAVVEPKVGEPTVVGSVDLTGNTFTTKQMNSLTKEEYLTLAKNNPFIIVDGRTIQSPLYRAEEAAEPLVKTIETNFETVGELLPTETEQELGKPASKEGYTPPPMGATELNTPAVREAVANVPTEVADAVIAIVENGTEEEIVQANEEVAKEFGAVAAGVLFDDAKAARGTGRSAVMDGLQTPYSVSADEEGYQPTSMGATELNTPAMRKAIAKVPTEVRDAVASLLERGDQEAIDQANEELAKEFGKDVAAVLFDDAKSARGTGKSAVMDGLQTPYTVTNEPTSSSPVARGLSDDAKSARGTGKSAVMDGLQTPGGLDTSGIRQVLSMVRSKIGPEVSSVLSKGYLQTTMGSTELNTPAILQALLKVEEQLGPDVADLITESFGPDVSAILFDDLKSARGTGKSAMMSGLQ
jgi:hypothetical protein|tara:strand:+ start:456 stop:2762 length:2307 start_codon:yes stop_codon:yes gene_type:complete